MMVEVGSLEALDVLSHAATVIAEGEVMQLATAKNLETTEDDYLEVVRSKTAALFAAASQKWAPSLPAKRSSTIKGFRSYGMNLGLAFQLIDDALDYGGNSARTIGKNTGDDFREGKGDASRRTWLTGVASDEERKVLERGNYRRRPMMMMRFRKQPELLHQPWRNFRYGVACTSLRRHGTRRARSDAQVRAQGCTHVDVLEFCISRAS